MKTKLLLLLLLFIISCSDKVIVDMRRGIVINKQFEPAHTDTMYISCGKECTVPIITSYPDKWLVTIKGNKMFENKDKIRYIQLTEETHVVSKEIYDRVLIGDDVWLPGYIKVGKEENEK